MKNKFRNLNEKAKFHLDQLMQEIHHVAYNEGYEAGQTVANLSEQSVEEVTHDGKVLQKVYREAREGDYVRPSKQKYAKLIDGEIYGPVFKGAGQLLVDGYQVYAKGHNRTSSTVEVFELVEAIPQIEKSPNQQRAELIEKAKETISDYISSDNSTYVKNGFLGEVRFYRKRNKVTCVITPYEKGIKRSVGRAFCNDDDVFNEDIGQVIALLKAKGLSVPLEFLEAVQPSHYAVGQIVQRHDEPIDSNKKYRVDKIKNGETLSMLFQNGKACCDTTKPLNHETENTRALKVFDDTNTQYEVTT